MFNKIVSIFLINLMFLWNIVFAEEKVDLLKERRKTVLENFKKQEIKNIFDNTEFFDASSNKSLVDSSKKIDMFSTLQSKTEEKRIYLESQNELLIERVNSLEKSISSIDKDIQDKITEVNITNIRIIKIKKDIESWKKAIEILKEKIKTNREILLEYVNHIYKKWNLTFNNDNNIDNIKWIILNWEDIWEILNDLHFKSILELTWQKLVEKHRQYVGSLYVKKMELESNEKNSVLLRNHLIIEKKVLDEKKEFKQRILEITKWKEELYKKYIKDKIEIEKKMKLKELKEIIIFQNTKNKVLKQNDCEYVDINKEEEKLYKMSNKCIELNKVIYAESKLQKLNYIWINPFKWPVTPSYGISAYYHDEWYKKSIWDEHDAIDIKVSQWSSVKAASDWYIIYLNPPTTDAYSYVAIKHSDWFVTVYWHLSEVLVRQYDYVKEWEIFAKSWWEYGTKWAWLLSTWPHLHFEVFQNKDFVDPLEFLDTSHITFNELPEKYKYKFYNDFKMRKWYEYQDVTKSQRWLKIDWLTEVERQKSLLSRYAKWWFSDWNMWVEESLDGDIDPTFVMCIGIAETWLWKHTKTDNNVWNVWNTDSWATKTMWSVRDWVRSIIFTLNNKYLWKYVELKDLSRYGNKTGSIYASSDFNWHNNITKCMSVIKQQYIPDTYNFRLYN